MAKRIPPHKVEEIYNAADVVEILQDYLQMKKRGSNYFALSPFTNEKTPSFAISPTKNIWKDFSTGKGGNAVTFLMEAEGMSYVEALKYIAAKYNIALDLEETPEDFARDDRRESLLIINEFAAKYFHHQLTQEETGKKIALSYFKERGILESTIETFLLGYSPDEWEALSKEALAQQYQEEYLEASGLAFRSDKTGRLIDRFRGRIMFPIHNHLGRVVGFGGRILGKKENTAKYVNSPESDVYHKSNVLYGLHFSKKAIRDQDQCLLVEGYMDVIALYQAGIENVVASSGTALTNEQIRLIKRFTKNVLLIFDADRAGIAAALRGIDLLLENELSVQVLLLPEGEDPDSYVKARGKSGFDAFVKEKGQDFLDFKLGTLAMELDLGEPEQKTQAIHETAQTLARIPDAVKQAVFLDKAAQRLSITPEIMQRSLNRALSDRARLEQRQKGFQQRQGQLTIPTADPHQGTATATSPDTTPTLTQVAPQEMEILRMMLNYPDKTVDVDGQQMPVMDYFQAELDGVHFDSAVLEEFKVELFDEYARSGRIDLNHFINHEKPAISRTASELLTIPYEVTKSWERFDIRAPTVDEDLEASVLSAMQHFHYYHVKRMLKELQQEVGKAKNEEELDQLVRKIQYLQEMKKELGEALGGIVIDL